MEVLNGLTENYGTLFMWASSTVLVIGAGILALALFLGVAERRDRLKRFTRPPWIDNRVYRHVKTRRLYRLLYCNAYQESDYPNTPLCIYQSLEDGALWARPAKEFFEPGRFREIGEYDVLLEQALCEPGKRPKNTPDLDDLSFPGMA